MGQRGRPKGSKNKPKVKADDDKRGDMAAAEIAGAEGADNSEGSVEAPGQ